MKNSVLQSIRTKFHGATNYRGSRITATSAAGMKCTIPYPHELNTEDAHRAAADALCSKLKWEGDLIQGSLSDGYVFVFADITSRAGLKLHRVAERMLRVERARLHEMELAGDIDPNLAACRENIAELEAAIG